MLNAGTSRRGHMDHDLTLHQIVDGISGLITVTTANGEVSLVNQHVLQYFGKSLDELKGWTASDAVHPDDLPCVVAAWQRSVRDGQPYELEHRIRGRDGAYRWFHVRGLPVRDATGRILRWFVLHTDIHERKRAEALLAGEKRLLEMVASGDALHVILDALCRLVEDNAGDCYCSVVLIDRSGTRLQHGAAPSLPASFNDSIHGRPVNVDSGPCAMAAYLREQVISADIMAETRWETCLVPIGAGPRSARLLVDADCVADQEGLGRFRDLLPRAQNTDALRPEPDRAGYAHCEYRHRARASGGRVETE
jgi:PAS domain S-box-containing protein